MSKEKTLIVLNNIYDKSDRLKDIRQRINDDSVTFDEIACVHAFVKNKTKGKATPKEVNDIILKLIKQAN